jgi:hypothetical protein
VLLLMSGGQFIAANVGSFEGAHHGTVHAAVTPALLPPPPLHLPELSTSDIDGDPEVHPDTAVLSARSRHRAAATDDGDEEDVFDDENVNDRENTSPPQAAAPLSSQLQPLGLSVSQQHVRFHTACAGVACWLATVLCTMLRLCVQFTLGRACFGSSSTQASRSQGMSLEKQSDHLTCMCVFVWFRVWPHVRALPCPTQVCPVYIDKC